MHILFMTISGMTPKADWNHKPQSNGCGSLGIEVGKFSKIKTQHHNVLL